MSKDKKKKASKNTEAKNKHEKPVAKTSELSEKDLAQVTGGVTFGNKAYLKTANKATLF